MQLKEAKKEGQKLLNYIQSHKEMFDVLGLINKWALVTVKNHEGWKVVNTRNFNNGIAKWCLGASLPFKGPDGKEHPGEDYYYNHTRRGDAHLLLVDVSEKDGLELLTDEELDSVPIDWNSSKGNWGVKYLVTYKPNGETIVWSQDNNICLADPKLLFGFDIEDYKSKVITLEKSYNTLFGVDKNLDVLKNIKGSERLSEGTRGLLSQLIVEAGFPQKIDLLKLIETSDLKDQSKLDLLKELESKSVFYL